MGVNMKTILTGVKPTDQAHIGNYLGAIRPGVEMSQQENVRSLLFIADYHALILVHDPEKLRRDSYDLAATWLACGLDPTKTIIYRQSDVPETFELSWILNCFTTKGLMNRAHAYKAKLAENQEAGKSDLDFGVSMGLFDYPVLMAADILLFSTDDVPVGEDQIQHVEIARDIAEKFNRVYKKEVLKPPRFVVQKEAKLVPGLDGRKMSKSYGNHIPLFCPSKRLRKLVMKIKTDSTGPDEPKDPMNSLIMDLYKEFSSEAEVGSLAERYCQGISWGEAKEVLYQKIDKELSGPREVYNEYMAHTESLEEILQEGAKKARKMARPLLEKVRSTIGVY
jgi:tryptophanyl-tRNA synthetase